MLIDEVYASQEIAQTRLRKRNVSLPADKRYIH